MRLGQKLTLFTLAAALVPLAWTGFSLVHLGERALRERLAAHQQAAAVAVSAKVAQAVEDLAHRLRNTLGFFDPGTLAGDERRGLLKILYKQSDDIAAAFWLDAAGVPVASPVYLEEPGTTVDLARHPASTAEQVEQACARLPLAHGLGSAPGSVVLSGVSFSGADAARVAALMPCCPDAEGKPAGVLGVELALRPSVLRVDGIEMGPESITAIVDAGGKIITHPSLPLGHDLSVQEPVATFLKHPGSGVLRYGPRHDRRAAAYASVGGLGWGVVVEQPESVAFAAADAMRRQTLVWIVTTALLVVGAGLWWTTRLRRDLERMSEGARAFGAGQLDRRIEVSARDERGELAATMNEMAARLLQSLREIDAWGRTLEEKVDERTRELRQAQAQLLLQSKLAAIGQLGSGVAHEVNNPLAAVLGYTQMLLKARDESHPEYKSLKRIEEAALRCKSVTGNLLRFSERGRVGVGEVNLNTIVSEVLELMAGGFEEAAVTVETELATQLPKITADGSQIALVMINLLSNARNAMPDGGQVKIVTEAAPQGVRITVRDTGHGIAQEDLDRIFDPFFTTKKVWTDIGLGLSVVYRIVTDHGGQIAVDSRPGEGAKFVIFLPETPPESVRDTAARPRPSILDTARRT